MRAKSWPEGATKTRQYDLLRSRVGQKEPPRLGSTICYGQELARKSHQDSAVRFVTAKRGPERATKTRQYEFATAKSWPERATKTRQHDLLRPNVGQKEPQNSAVRFLLRPRVGQKEPPRLGSTVCYGQTWARKSHRDSARPPPPLAHEFFRPCPRISRPCPRISRPCPRISRPCPRISISI